MGICFLTNLIQGNTKATLRPRADGVFQQGQGTYSTAYTAAKRPGRVNVISSAEMSGTLMVQTASRLPR